MTIKTDECRETMITNVSRYAILTLISGQHIVGLRLEIVV